MIIGVIVKKVEHHYDDRGVFVEIIKEGEPTYLPVKQTNYAETLPGVIKAFHWHKNQSDMWYVVKGMAQVVLYDLRENSETKGQTDVFYCGDNNRLVITIPPGVAHGYRVLGYESMGIFYHTDQIYDPKNPDEQRIPFDAPEIGFDWHTKNR